MRKASSRMKQPTKPFIQPTVDVVGVVWMTSHKQLIVSVEHKRTTRHRLAQLMKTIQSTLQFTQRSLVRVCKSICTSALVNDHNTSTAVKSNRVSSAEHWTHYKVGYVTFALFTSFQRIKVDWTICYCAVGVFWCIGLRTKRLHNDSIWDLRVVMNSPPRPIYL